MRRCSFIHTICLSLPASLLALSVSACAASWHTNSQNSQPVTPAAAPPNSVPPVAVPDQPPRNPPVSPGREPGSEPNGPQSPAQNPDGTSQSPNQNPDQNQGQESGSSQLPNAKQPLVDVRSCESRSLRVDVVAGENADQAASAVTALLTKYPQLHFRQSEAPIDVAFEIFVGLSSNCQTLQCAEEDGWNRLQEDLRAVPGVWFRCAEMATEPKNDGSQGTRPGRHPRAPIVRLLDQSTEQ